MNHPHGTIIHFTSFRFKDGGHATRPAEKDKYFIVLRNTGDMLVIACLPSSQDKVSEQVEQVHGCNRYPSGGFAAYIFEKGRPITTSGWAFPLRTYMYPFGVEEYDKRALAATHPQEGIDHVVKGRLTEKEFLALITCLSAAVDIKRKMRAALDGVSYDGPGLVKEPSSRYGVGAH